MKYTGTIKIALCLIFVAIMGLARGDRIGMTLPVPVIKVCNIIALICAVSICIISCLEMYKSKQIVKFGIWIVLGLCILIFSIKMISI